MNNKEYLIREFALFIPITPYYVLLEVYFKRQLADTNWNNLSNFSVLITSEIELKFFWDAIFIHKALKEFLLKSKISANQRT